MFERIEIQEAKATRWDVILAGSSFASMFFLKGLSPELRVLVVEKGAFLSHAAQSDIQPLSADPIRQDNASGEPKEWVAHTLFGGNSNCWSGQAPRFHPHDFDLKSRYGIGVDWPISYATLEPFYQRAEDLMEVAGGGSDHILPRTQPFPFAHHTLSLSDIALAAHDPNWVAAPCARSMGGALAPCCGNGVCAHCPVDAKFTIVNAESDFARAGVFLLTGAEARTLVVEAGQATRLTVRVDGVEHEISADLFGLGTNAIYNAAILLRSGFGAPDLGCHLHEQVSRRVFLDVPIRNGFGGTRITGHGYPFYDGPHRSTHAAILIENVNAPFTPRYEPGKWTERLHFKLIAEDLPQRDNRVVLDPDGEPRVLWTGYSDYATSAIDRAIDAMPTVLPFEIEDMEVHGLGRSQAHIQGTTRIGATVNDGVLDERLRTHEAPNVVVLGAGAFPTCSPANPTLTLAALSLYAAQSV